MEKEEKYLYLKFGDVKGGDFKGSAKAEKVYYIDRKECVTNEDYKKNALRVIDLFNGSFLIWCGQQKVSKKKAKDYIINYEKQSYSNTPTQHQCCD